MDHMFSSNERYESHWNTPNKEGDQETVDSGHEEELPFLHFPSPFLDEISTTPIPANHQQHHLSVSDKPLDSSNGTTSDPSPSETKCVKQRRNAGKKDRHSKIHTAQGFRDRRMRLSLEIARKFFDLQDLLGFDKASKTIEWLFCKSNKAIKEVMESSNSQYTNQSMSEEIKWSISPLSECEVESTMENTATTNKGGNLRGQSRKRMQSNPLARETREKARARARERTRGRMMIKDLKKSEQLFTGNCNDDFDNLGLGFSESPNNHNMEELEYSSSPLKMIHQDTWSPSLEYSHTHHLLRQLQMANGNQSLENYFGSSSTDCSIFINHKKAADPPAGWLNSSNRFMGFLGEWDAENFIMEYNNNGIVPNVPNVAAMAGNIHRQNPSPNSMSASKVLHFQYENQGK